METAQRLCEFCGKPFTSARSTQKFCQVSCGQTASNQRRRRIAKQKEPDNNDAITDEGLLAEAQRRGFVLRPLEIPDPVARVSIRQMQGDKRVIVAVVSCTHLGSRFQQITALGRFLQYAKGRGAKAILHCGDVVDGPLQMHQDIVHSQFLHTYDTQRDYAVTVLPDLGLPWYFVSGNHDDAYLRNAGGEIVQDICERRKDFHYLARNTGYVQMGAVTIELTHPHMGTAYADSYRLQKHIEALSPERKPNVVCMGNFHKAGHIDYRNVVGLMVPAFQSQTPWMASKGLRSIVGGLILEFGMETKGLAPSYRVEWVIERIPLTDDWQDFRAERGVKNEAK